jgi:two-component system invasion response regulator UvrY
VIKVLIVDDHMVVREGLKQILSETSDIAVIDEADRGYVALKKIKEKEFNVVILDISLPDVSGLDILKLFKQQRPNINVLILSIYSEEQYAIRALRSGASGYLSKESVSEELIRAIRKISRGGKYIPPPLAEKLAFALEVDFKNPLHEILSDREYQVMCMIASGKTVKDISGELFLSHKTISTYRQRILQKMKMKNNTEIIRYAIKNKLID